MFFIIKSLFYIALLVVGGIFLVNYFPDLKTRALETINPAYKEDRLLAQLGTSLGQLELSIQNASNAKTPTGIKTQLTASQKLLAEVKTTLQTTTAINKKQTEGSLTSQTVSKIAELFVSRSTSPTDPTTSNPALENTKTTDSTSDLNNSSSIASQTCLPR